MGVVLVDADPNAPHEEWRKKTVGAYGRLEDGLVLHAHYDEDGLAVMLRRIEHEHPDKMIIVDVEGRGSKRTLHGMSVCDAVIVPMMASGLDGEETVKTFAVYAQVAQARALLFPCAVLFSRMPTVGGAGTRDALEEQFAEVGIDVIAPAMMDRPILRDMTLWGGSLWQIMEDAQAKASDAPDAKTRKAEKAVADRCAAAIEMLDVVCAAAASFVNGGEAVDAAAEA